MKLTDLRKPFFIGSAALLAGALAIAGCQNKQAHPDEKDAVTNALKSNNLASANVSQDRQKGVITLTGDVNSEDQKAQAAVTTKQAAPDYTIADELGVVPQAASSQANAIASNLDSAANAIASNLDSAIEDNYKAEIEGHKNLDDQSIDYRAKNGTFVLSGAVKTASQKREAEKLAKAVPNVLQVVNEIEVRPGKHPTPNS